MSIEVVLEGTLETEKDYEAYIHLIKEICERMKLKMETFEKSAVIDVCPEGFVECSYADSFLSISAQSNVAGPGFHAYVCTLFDEICKVSPIELTMSDPTNYFDDRNFEKLQATIFNRWLQEIGTYVQELQDTSQNLCISWPLDYYQPMAKDGFVITPMGYIAVVDFKNMPIEDLAQRFFVWNQKGRDAYYYRNAAINLLWKECYYEYSNMNEYTEKMCDMILDYLEIAYELQPSLPLPLIQYESLCAIRGRASKLNDAQVMHIASIGYRIHNVEFHFGNWSIPAHGCCERSMDENSQTLYLMAPYKSAEEPWAWMYKVNIFSFNQEVTTFLKEIETAQDHMNRFHFVKDEVNAMGIVEKKEDHLLMSVQLNCGKEMMMLQLVICDETKLDELIENVKQIKCRQIKDDVVKN